MKRYSFLLVSIAGIMWGLDSIFITPRYFTYSFYNTAVIVFFNHLIPSIFLLLFYFKNLKQLYTLFKKNSVIITLSSILGSLIGTLSIVKALSLTNFEGFSIVAIIQQLHPIVAALLAVTFLKEKPKKQYPFILISSIILIYTMKFGFRLPTNTNNDIQVVLYSLLAVISYGSSTVFSKKMAITVGVYESVFFRYIITTITLLPFILLLKSNRESLVISFNNISVIKLAFINSIWGLAGLYIYFAGVFNLKALQITLAELAYPISTVLLDYAIYKTNFSITTIVSIVLLICITIYFHVLQIKSKNSIME